MKISKGKFESEIGSLLNAAESSNDRGTAEGYLNSAENKIYGYDNIPTSLQNSYLSQIEDVRDGLEDSYNDE